MVEKDQHHDQCNAQDNSIKLTQTGLTKRIIDALKIQHLPKKDTPALSTPLTKNEQGESPNGTYNYASVIGMMWYLQGHSRPELSFPVSQCARFSHSPRCSQEEALERIGQYLKGTQDDGLILRRSNNLDIDVYVDVDFAG